MLHRSVAATADEHARQLPGDSLIPDAAGQLTHAITIQRPPRDVWPWLAQMGAGSRAGWYSYDRLDNGGHPSATRINPRLQHIVVSTLFPALPGRTDGFTVLHVEPGAHLVLGWLAPDGTPVTTWTFVLTDVYGSSTRLIVRSRASRRHPFLGLPAAIGFPLIRAVHFVMQRRQLLGIAQRVEEADTLLEHFMPAYDIVERHRVRVGATAHVTLDAARHVDLRSSALIRAIVRLRALAMGDADDGVDRPRGLLAETTSMGWRVLAEVPGREVIVGAAAQPWLPNVTFRPIAPDDFATFNEPGWVKIVWTLRIDSDWPDGVVFGTETRAIATDAGSRAKFLHYWTRVVPGVVAIRWILLRLLRKNAEANRLESLVHGRSH
jgi:uncharacterized protein YndB with AHSA1/START domain